MSGKALALQDLALEEPRFVYGALALLALLVLLALVRRPRKLAVPSLHLWEQAVEGSLLNRALPVFRALRALLTAAAILLAGALCAGPIEHHRGQLDWLLVVDLSPSMDAREADGRTRLDLAREAVKRFVERLPDHDRVDLLVAADPPRLACAPDAPRARVLESLARLQSEAPAADLSGALEIAASAQRVPVLFGDGAGARAALARPERALFFGVGEARANRAFVSFALEAAWPSPARITWKLATSGGASAPASLELVDPRGRVTELPGSAGGAEPSAELPSWTGGIWTLRLREADALAFDDAVRFHLDGLEPRGIALRGTAQRPVHPALAVAFELAAQSFEVPLRWLAPEEAPRADEVLVQDGGALRAADLPAAGALLFGTAIEGRLVEEAEAPTPARAAAVVRLESARPALAGLPLDRLRVRRAHLKPVDAAAFEPWVAGPDRPLLYAAAIDGVRVLGTTFELRESNLAAEASFAVLAHRLLLELAQPRAPAPALFEAGRSEAPWMRSATDEIAGGTMREPWPAAPLQMPAVLPREGTHELRGTPIPIELLDAEASEIAPGWAPGWAGEEPPRPEEPRPLGDFVALLLLLVLLARAGLDLLAAT